MSLTLTYNKTLPTENRNSINDEIIKCCENMDVNRLFQVLDDSYIFDKYGAQDVFDGLAHFRDMFTKLKQEGITTLTSCNTICTGCEYGRVVTGFRSAKYVHFAFMFVENEGIADQVIFCNEHVDRSLTDEEIKRKQDKGDMQANYPTGISINDLKEKMMKLPEEKRKKFGF